MRPTSLHPNAPVDLQARRDGPAAVLYDAARITPPGPDAFAPQTGPDGAPAGGRGTTVFTELEGVPAVLRTYRRGGWLGDRLGERYARVPLRWTRPWREARLLATLYNEGLPVPAPLAARVVFRGAWYRAALITQRLAGTRTLAQRMSAGRLPAEAWARIGATIARLHARGVDHADLNAHNILLSQDDARVWIVDLDRGRIRTPRVGWQRRNVQRLERSCLKLATLARQDGTPFFPLDGTDLDALLEGWNR